MSELEISVVILTKNGQKYLDSLLRSVFLQEVDFKFEVIVIDSGSTDKTLDILAGYPVKLYQIKPGEFNHGLSRNYGISKAQGKYIIFLTQDAVPSNNIWMKNLVNNLYRDQMVAGAYSRQIPHKDARPLSRIKTNMFFTASSVRRESRVDKTEDFYLLSPKEKHRFCNFDNVSSCIRKDIWERIPFSETEFAEDLEWSLRILKAGYKIVYDPDSIVFHSHNFSPLEWHKRIRMNSCKISCLFRLNTADNFFQLLLTFLFSTLKDYYLLYREGGSLAALLSGIYLVPTYSLLGAWGQYRGSKDALHFK